MSLDRHRTRRGTTVFVKDDNVEKALRKFKKKIAESNLLQNLRDKEFFEKPTITRKKKRAAAVNRWQKFVRSQSLPKKLF